ncbi:hypothetical protein M9H77_36248 [Catharanthus roseus]|uniref:Uncharacterized protein n=1 Tax=Catharanthus roseus TaxID=4058 RepID=A0ACB9ZT85_CATRO|nr:hypothetical protein M9H77_36248 [Catharanthus roseus]
MRIAFEQLCVTQDIRGAQLAEIVESTRRYVDELAHQRVYIYRQEVMLAHLLHNCKTSFGFQKGRLLDHFENHDYLFSYMINGF